MQFLGAPDPALLHALNQLGKPQLSSGLSVNEIRDCAIQVAMAPWVSLALNPDYARCKYPV